jgi:hypothetical protein
MKKQRKHYTRRMKRITSGSPTIRESLTVSAFLGTNSRIHLKPMVTGPAKRRRRGSGYRLARRN